MSCFGDRVRKKYRSGQMKLNEKIVSSVTTYSSAGASFELKSLFTVRLELCIKNRKEICVREQYSLIIRNN